MKLTLRLIAVAGLLLFVPLLAVTFLSPIQVERAARGYIEDTIEQRVEDMLGFSVEKTRSLGHLATKLAGKHKEELQALKDRITSGLNERIAAEVARLQELSCTCRELLRTTLDLVVASQINAIEEIAPQLQQIIEGNYVEIVRSLMLDIRIFAGTNTVAFLLLLILSITRQDRIRQLFIPGLLLAISVILSSLNYAYGQDWFFVALQADYMGWAYAIWMIVIFSFLFDIALNRARVTSEILSAFGNSITSASPC